MIATEIDALAADVRSDILDGISDEDIVMTLKTIRAMAVNLQNIGKK